MEVMFNLQYQFGLRGRETLRDLTVNSIGFSYDASSREYIFLNDCSLSKNVKASLSQKEYTNLISARIYGSDTNLRCPIRSMRLYLSKIPNNVKGLFPKPVKKAKFDDCFWYCTEKMLGHNSIGGFMKMLSQAAKLRQIYTNHCIRSTVVNELKESGMTNDDIASVTGHKCVSSIQRYTRQRRDVDKQKISDCLQKNDSSSSAFCTESSNKVSRLENCDIIEISQSQSNTSLEIVNAMESATTRPIAFHFTGNFTNCTFNTKTSD